MTVSGNFVYDADTGPVIATQQTARPSYSGGLSGIIAQTTDGQSKIIGYQDFFTDFRVSNRYEYDKHIYMAGLTSPNPNSLFPTSTFFQMSAPTMLWIADWTAARRNDIPTIPEPDPDPASGWVLLDTHYETAEISTAGDGITPFYRITGTYVYGATRPNPTRPMTFVNFGRPPWLADVFQRAVSPLNVETLSFDPEPPGTLLAGRLPDWAGGYRSGGPTH